MPQPAPPVPDFLYGTAWKEDRTPALTELALRMGFRGIDTANQRRHYFEEGVGQGLAAAYRAGLVTRDDLLSANKIYLSARSGSPPTLRSRGISFRSSRAVDGQFLEHLATDRVDSYVLHGPASNYDWTDSDAEVWEAMRKERDAGRTRLLGVSNVSLQHLQQMASTNTELPAFVQNRCYARLGWDRAVRQFCREHKIVYQGFSLLTANQEVVHDALIANLAASANVTPAQVAFSFARSIGILPLTGTSNAWHMKQDVASRELTLSQEAIQAIESLSG